MPLCAFVCFCLSGFACVKTRVRFNVGFLFKKNYLSVSIVNFAFRMFETTRENGTDMQYSNFSIIHLVEMFFFLTLTLSMVSI